jgi:hypothetical protein
VVFGEIEEATEVYREPGYGRLRDRSIAHGTGILPDLVTVITSAEIRLYQDFYVCSPEPTPRV